jgi:hypothetical protein
MRKFPLIFPTEFRFGCHFRSEEFSFLIPYNCKEQKQNKKRTTTNEQCGRNHLQHNA